MSAREQPVMSPDEEDSQQLPALAEPEEELEIQSVDGSAECSAPVLVGILSTGAKPKKRVTFRDSNLVLVREIPARPRSADNSSESGGSSCGDDDADEETPDDSDSSESGLESPSDKEDEDEDEEDVGSSGLRTRQPEPAISKVTGHLPTGQNAANVRAERAPIVWSKTPAFAQKGPQEISASPSQKIVSLMSQITATSTVPTQTPASTSRLKPSPPPKTVPTKTRVEKTVRQITPTLDTLLTYQPTSRIVNRQVAEALPSQTGARTVKKKRAFPRKPDSSERRRKAPSSRKSRETPKQGGTKAGGGSASMQNRDKTRNSSSVLSGVRDSLTLPSLVSDDSAVGQSTRGLQQLSVARVYTVDGFIFPGDPDLSVTTAFYSEDRKVPSYPPGTSPTFRPISRERVSSALSTSPARRKRFYAWQMANGDLESSLPVTPCIAPMWESVQPVCFTSKSSSTSER